MKAFDRKLEALEALSADARGPETAERLRKALGDRNNYYVSKAAAIAAAGEHTGLVPDLLAALERFFTDAAKSDPQCWAKNAIARALKELGHRDAATYLRGMAHRQFEPVWGGKADTAATLRGACALALVDCPLNDLEAVTAIVDLLADPEKPVRVEGALALAQLGALEAIPALRLKAALGDGEPEVLGQCFASLLALDPAGSVEFVRRFLDSERIDVSLEAAAALAQAREPRALQAIEQFWGAKVPSELRKGILLALSASPLPQAGEFLLRAVREESAELASAAITALAASRFSAEVRERIGRILVERRELKLDRVFTEEFARRG